jgi:pyruvate/2-oxoglutarate dehydrogenase complex dihydrolipoamide dehydrogenase (E3) component
VSAADAIIIGSGQGGVPLAADLAGQGLRVVLFERAALGGTCVNYGCTPSKAFLAAAHRAAMQDAPESLGVELNAQVDFPAVMERVRGLIGSFREGVGRRLERAGVEVVPAAAKFTGPRRLRGGDVEVEAPLVVVNTGTSPNIPPIEGLNETPFLTYRNFWELTDLPERTVVLGGGYVGVELGQGLARLGSSVTLVNRSETLVGQEEPEIRDVLAQALQSDGVELCFGTQAERVEHRNGQHRITLQDGRVLEADALLVATGQRPNTEALDAQAAGIELDQEGYVWVDECLRTSADGVYAMGDVAGQPAFTHVSWEDYRRIKALLAGEPRTRSDRVLGYAFFTEPQVGRAGLTQQQAEQGGRKVRRATLPLEQVARATETGQTRGIYTLVVEEESERILGASLAGPGAGELIHVIIALMETEASWRTLERSAYIHPTFAEGLTSLARKLN